MTSQSMYYILSLKVVMETDTCNRKLIWSYIDHSLAAVSDFIDYTAHILSDVQIPQKSEECQMICLKIFHWLKMVWYSL